MTMTAEQIEAAEYGEALQRLEAGTHAEMACECGGVLDWHDGYWICGNDSEDPRDQTLHAFRQPLLTERDETMHLPYGPSGEPF